MGVGIAAMHYTGMAAMQMAGYSIYNPIRVAASVAIAIGSSIIALWLAVRFRHSPGIGGQFWKLTSACVMGAAITGMHYTGMPSSTVLMPNVEQGSGAFNRILLIATVILAASIIFSLSLIALWVVRRLATQDADLAASEQRFRSLFDHHPDAVYSIDRTGRFVRVNPASEQLTGFTAAEFIGQPSLRFVTREDLERSRHYFVEALRGQPQHYEASIRHKDGSVLNVQMTLVPMIVEDQIVGIFGVAKDITERRQAAAQLMHQALHDSLTGLPNRALFLDRLSQAYDRAQRNRNHRFAVLFVDLDRFKPVNDILGHRFGDQVLVTVAQRLMARMRTGDTVARLGGDEFAVLLEGLHDAPDALPFAKHILDVLSTPFEIEDQVVFVNASIGIAVSTPDYAVPADLLRDADIAMYRAKASGAGRYELFDPVMRAQVIARSNLEAELRRAIEEGEFQLHYQPRLSLTNGRVPAVEALVRWNRPGHGLVAPGEFIRVAEETGLIIPLGVWVLQTACTQAKIWQDAGLEPVGVGVNISARQFRDRELPATIAQILEMTGLDPQYLELELTESSIMEDAEEAILMMQELQALNVQIAIDDFGTGYSSLSYLKRFPITALKIDQSFVRDITTDANSAAIAKTIIAMAHQLGLQVIAEGVETDEQLHFLQHNACDASQGHLFSRPMPVETLTRFLETANPVALRHHLAV